MAATAQCIRSLKQTGDAAELDEAAPISFDAFPAEQDAPPTTVAPAQSEKPGSSKPSLRDLTDSSARRPKKLTDFQVNASISSSLGSIKLAPATTASPPAATSESRAAPPGPLRQQR